METEKKQTDEKRNFERIYDRNLRGGVYAGGGVVSLHREALRRQRQ